MTLDDAFDGLSAPTNGALIAAMQGVLDDWDAARFRCLALLFNYVEGSDQSETTERALFPILYLLAEKHETVAFNTICALVADSERADLIMGGTIGEGLPGILINCFAGEAAPLRHLIEDTYGHPIVRDSALFAMGYLTQIKRVPRSEMQAFLVELHDKMPNERDNDLAINWIFVVALLGMRALVSRVMALFGTVPIKPDIINPQAFQTILREAAEEPSNVEGFLEIGIRPQGSAIEAMTYSDGDLAPPLEEPFVNPLRNVGRNDPCPCGSGKKFKKCCLV